MRVLATFPAPADSLRAEVQSGSGFTVTVDSADAATPSGASPRESVLIGLVGCTGMDVASILAKKRQPPASYQVAVEAECADRPPRVFTRIVIEHRVSGAVEAEAVRRAIELSATRYCPVTAMLSRSVVLEHRYRLTQPGQADQEALVVITGPDGSNR
jgi:putative redox protein